jgi:polar amino acid transport system substrate-binding protein
VSGRAEAFAYDDVVALELARQHTGLRTVGKPFRPRFFAIAARPDDGDLMQWVNGWLAKLDRTGVYDQLWRKYFGEYETVLLRATAG